jgi:hypothetical protein
VRKPRRKRARSDPAVHFRERAAWVGWVHEFCADKFLPKTPPDFELTSLSQTFGNDRIIETAVL